MLEQLTNLRETYFDSMVISAASSEIVGGAAAVILAILGLAGYGATEMVAAGFIGLGAAFALNGGLLAAERSRVLAQAQSSSLDAAQFSSGVSVEAVAGIAAIVLAILTLLKIDASVLMPVAALVSAIGMIFTSGTLAQLNWALVSRSERATTERVTHSAVVFAAAFHFLVGVGAIVLAVLALIGFTPLVLSLVALLALGSASVLSGASVASRMVGIAPHREAS
jgi:hypothetical protein